MAQRNIFLVDDNLHADPSRFRELLAALIPLKIRWIGQVDIAVTLDPELLRLMRNSGCIGVLIGFESLNRGNLDAMGKGINGDSRRLETGLAALRRHGLAVYGTFVFGYDNDDEGSFAETLAFALRHKLFFAAFNHLVPFPGTPLYDRLRQDGRLIEENWWLSPEYRFGDLAFYPQQLTPRQLGDGCFDYRRKFYRLGSVVRRALDFRANCRSPFMIALFLFGNLLSGRDVHRRQRLPLGNQE